MVAGSDVVDVWVVGDGRVEGLLGVLDDEELRRVAACRSEGDARRFVLAHGALRHIAARALGAPPGGIRWARGPHGKPELAGPWRGVQVNLSHSGAYAMIAVTASRAVGVDVQRVLPRLDAAAMARRYFPPHEARYVASAADAEARATRFARLWARKEALVKAHGGRLLQGLRVPVTSPRPPALPTRDAWSLGYRLTDIPAPAGYRAALALAGTAEFTPALHDWPEPPPP